MSKSDLQGRPVYHRKRDSIEAHLTIVFAALAVTRWIEARTGWSIRKFVRTARRYRTIEIQAGRQTITAADPLPDDLRRALHAINQPADLRTKLSQLRFRPMTRSAGRNRQRPVTKPRDHTRGCMDGGRTA